MDRSALDAELADFFSSDEDGGTDLGSPPEPVGLSTRLSHGAAELEKARGDAASPAALPPPLSRARGAPTLQRRCCEWLARNLGALDDLDDLPEHLSSQVKDAIEADRRLLEDDGLEVWLAAVVKTGVTTALCLRWASGLTDAGMVAFAQEEAWISKLWRLDIAFCSGVGDRGLGLVAAMAPQLTSLAVSGCRNITDQGIAAVGSSIHGLVTMEMEMLSRVSDFGIQALVRGCSELEVLLLGGCSQLSNISTQLIVDHLAPSLRRLDLGGLPTIIDMDLEDIRRCTALESLSVRACGKLTDAGLLQLATLCERQTKQAAKKASRSAGRGGELSKAHSQIISLGLATLDLGGLVRLTDGGLSKLLRQASSLTALDLSGCSGLSATGLVDAIGALPAAQRQQFARLTMTGMTTAPSEASNPSTTLQRSGMWAEKSTWERVQQLLGSQALVVYE